MKTNTLEHSSATSRNPTAYRRDETIAPSVPINGVIYCRVSSKEQIEGTSLESQEIACQEYAQTHRIKVLRAFVERGESAKFADRTQLIELIDFCRTSKEKIEALLVWKLDRFARNVGDHFNIKATLLRYGVRVVSVTEPIDANPEGKLMETILAGFAQFDNDIRAARTVQGMRRKIQEGIFPWKAPLGYKSPARESTKKTKPDEPDQPLFGLLQRAWKEFTAGIHTKADIQRLMESWGVQTQAGISMTPQSLDNFFRNPFYAGILVDPWSGEQYAGAHVPMVTPQEFSRVQSIITRRNRSMPHHKERPEFPLRGVARCTDCEHSVTGGFSQGRSQKYAYYRCDNRKCSSQGSYRTQDVDEEFGALLDRIAVRPELVNVLKSRIAKVAERAHLVWKTRRDRKNAEVTRLDKETHELIRMRAQGLITDGEFTTLKGKIAAQQHALAAAAMPARVDSKRIGADLEEITLPLHNLKRTWQTIPAGFQRRFNYLVVPVGFVVGQSRTAELGPLFSVLEQFDQANSHEVPLTGENLNRLYQAIQAFADLFRDIDEVKKAA
jgi:site-specific DNA recombinase